MKKIELVEIRQVNDALAEMVALFRVELRSYKGIASKPNVEDGREEMKEYLLAGFPVFAATVHGEYAGYVVCRIERGGVGGIHLCQRRVPPAGSCCRTAWQGRRNCSFLWKRYGLQLCPSQ